ncbi:sigma-54-dependent transcriptional regulator [candidate division CSSED10-310 bacterium]|uniref:Sigma-54-dependent transcriptional regulator n=1 Tax=candidate division CSSED10-310 bacterium TaxID=2855610 RepID=A0ABV6YZE2_UNCC1
MNYDVLIIDDNQQICEALHLLLDIHELTCLSAPSPPAALALLKKHHFKVVIQDMNFSPNATSGAEGQQLFTKIKALNPHTPIILLTAWTALEMAVSLVKEGADDYLSKPWDDAKLIARIKDLVAGHSDKKTLHPSLQDAELCGLVYKSKIMENTITLALSVAKADVAVLISGPNGSGKEKIADIIQANSLRKEKPFIKVNVGALPGDLMESELFGAEPGAYTGAVKKRLGRFEAADRGTLFLDEIGNLALTGQIKLLRVLQSGEFERLGSTVTRTADVRIISATNADLHTLIQKNLFREDLFFRLNVIEIKVPPLSERKEDILPLARHFIRSFAQQTQSIFPAISHSCQKKLQAYSWPGNIRELRNRVQRALLVAHRDELVEADFDLPKVPAPQSSKMPPSEDPGSEKDLIEKTLLQTGGTVSRAAKILGLSRQALYRKMDKYGLEVERKIKGDTS